jgi:hypothetical protein
MKVPYYSLLVLDGDMWAIEFGGYTKAEVKQEWQDLKHRYARGTKHAILCSDDTAKGCREAFEAFVASPESLGVSRLTAAMRIG